MSSDEKVYLKVTVGRAYKSENRYDIVVELVNANDEQVKEPCRLYLEAEADGVLVHDARCTRVMADYTPAPLVLEVP